MDIWLQIAATAAITIIGVAITLYLSHRETTRAIERVTESLGRHIGEAVRAIHEDIGAAQAKIQSKLKEEEK